MTIDPRLNRIVAAQPYPLLFATISGAHLYGFPSPDSDFDLRGAHVLPLEQVVGLDVKHETVEDSRIIDGLDMDIVSHAVKKFFGLLLKKNGYVLEQLFSPLIVHATPEHEELKAICNARQGGTSVASLSPREERAGREPERGVSDQNATFPRPHCHLVKLLIKKSMYIVFTIWFHNEDAKLIGIFAPTLASSHRANPRPDFRQGFLCASSRSHRRLYPRASFDVSCRHAFVAPKNQ